MVVVVVLTVCLDDVSDHATKRPAPNPGGHVSVDMTRRPCACAHRPQKATLPGVSVSDCSVATGKETPAE